MSRLYQTAGCTYDLKLHRHQSNRAAPLEIMVLITDVWVATTVQCGLSRALATAACARKRVSTFGTLSWGKLASAAQAAPAPAVISMQAFGSDNYGYKATRRTHGSLNKKDAPSSWLCSELSVILGPMAPVYS